jgi:hypothetical protein
VQPVLLAGDTDVHPAVEDHRRGGEQGVRVGVDVRRPDQAPRAGVHAVEVAAAVAEVDDAVGDGGPVPEVVLVGGGGGPGDGRRVERPAGGARAGVQRDEPAVRTAGVERAVDDRGLAAGALEGCVVPDVRPFQSQGTDVRRGNSRLEMVRPGTAQIPLPHGPVGAGAASRSGSGACFTAKD